MKPARVTRLLCLGLAVAVLGASGAGGQGSDGGAESQATAEPKEQDEAWRLSHSGEVENLAKAAVLYEKRVAENPESFDAQLGAARSLVLEMTVKSNGNLPLVDGLQDSEANRALWSELAPRALEHARKASALQPESVEAAALLANSYMYYASSLGIISAILKGSGGEYREHANRLVELDPKYEDALGDFLLACFYLVAPWPVGDSDEAKAHYERAAEISPKSVRNQYGLGVYWAREGEEARARQHFRRVREQPCEGRTEQLLCAFMKQEAGRALESLGKG